MKTKIDTTKFFSISYQKKDGTIEEYIVRAGVQEWKDMNGQQCAVKGTGHGAAEGQVKLYAVNRKGYRTFIVDNILRIKQGDILIERLAWDQIFESENN